MIKGACPNDIENNPFSSWLVNIQRIDLGNVDLKRDPKRNQQIWESRKNFLMSMMVSSFKDKHSESRQNFVQKVALQNLEQSIHQNFQRIPQDVNGKHDIKNLMILISKQGNIQIIEIRFVEF